MKNLECRFNVTNSGAIHFIRNKNAKQLHILFTKTQRFRKLFRSFLLEYRGLVMVEESSLAFLSYDRE